MSSVIRVGQPERFTQDGSNATGQAWTQAPYVQITWGWLAFLAGELLLAVVFLAVTMISQAINRRRSARRQGPEGQFAYDIKDSSLAPLVVLSEAGREVLGTGVQPVDELKRTAKDIRVRLVGNELVPVATKEPTLPVVAGLGIDRVYNLVCDECWSCHALPKEKEVRWAVVIIGKSPASGLRAQ